MIKIGVVNGDVIEAGGVKNVTNNYYGNDAKPADVEAGEDLHIDTPTRGPRPKFLFPKDGKETVENVAIRNQEKQRLTTYLNQHRLMSRHLVCTKGDALNKVIVCFMKEWRERKLTSEEPSGGAVFRFLTEICGIVSDVMEKAYSNRVKGWIKDKTGYDMETYLKVKESFKNYRNI